MWAKMIIAVWRRGKKKNDESEGEQMELKI
jgi:hypothetical protein